MSARHGFLTVAVAAAAGALSGALAVAFAPRPQPTTQVTRDVYYVATPEGRGLPPADGAGVVASPSHPDAGVARTVELASARRRTPETPEAREADRVAREGAHADAIEQHYREPDDPAWSRATERTVSEHLQALAVGMEGVSVVQVDCRRDTCATVLEWDTFDRARLGFRPFIERSLGVNCEQRIVLPEPADRSTRYQAIMIMRNCDGRD